MIPIHLPARHTWQTRTCHDNIPENTKGLNRNEDEAEARRQWVNAHIPYGENIMASIKVHVIQKRKETLMGVCCINGHL